MSSVKSLVQTNHNLTADVSLMINNEGNVTDSVAANEFTMALAVPSETANPLGVAVAIGAAVVGGLGWLWGLTAEPRQEISESIGRIFDSNDDLPDMTVMEASGHENKDESKDESSDVTSLDIEEPDEKEYEEGSIYVEKNAERFPRGGRILPDNPSDSYDGGDRRY